MISIQTQATFLSKDNAPIALINPSQTVVKAVLISVYVCVEIDRSEYGCPPITSLYPHISVSNLSGEGHYVHIVHEKNYKTTIH